MNTTTKERPGSEALAKSYQVEGTGVRLGDGAEWLVPCVRRWPAGTALPEIMRLNRAGQVEYELQPRDKPLVAAAEKLWTSLMVQIGALPAEAGPELTLEEEVKLAMDALMVNYRLTREEINARELLTTDTVAAICLAAVDWGRYRAWVLERAQEARRTVEGAGGAVGGGQDEATQGGAAEGAGGDV